MDVNEKEAVRTFGVRTLPGAAAWNGPVLALTLLLAFPVLAAQPARNPLIDYQAFAANVAEVGLLREQRRISEEEFIRMAREPGTVVLDARSETSLPPASTSEGAVNLSFSGVHAETLRRTDPDRDTRVLIYCNNKLRGGAGLDAGEGDRIGAQRIHVRVAARLRLPQRVRARAGRRP
jgi:hypothetical protein